MLFLPQAQSVSEDSVACIRRIRQNEMRCRSPPFVTSWSSSSTGHQLNCFRQKHTTPHCGSKTADMLRPIRQVGCQLQRCTRTITRDCSCSLVAETFMHAFTILVTSVSLMFLFVCFIDISYMPRYVNSRCGQSYGLSLSENFL